MFHTVELTRFDTLLKGGWEDRDDAKWRRQSENDDQQGWSRQGDQPSTRRSGSWSYGVPWWSHGPAIWYWNTRHANAERIEPNVNIVTIKGTSSTFVAIMLAILLVLVSFAGMYFHKHFKVVRREDDEYADMPELIPFDDMPELIPSDDGRQSSANAENRRCKFPHLGKLEYGRHVNKDTKILSNPAESTIGERSACESKVDPHEYDTGACSNLINLNDEVRKLEGTRPGKYRARMVFKGSSENASTGAQEKAVKAELQKLKERGLLSTLTDEDAQAIPALFLWPRSRLSLRYCGCAKPSEIASIIDNGKKKDKKVHVWPGCRKLANRTDAIRLNIHRLNGLGEDRAQILFDSGLWCKECNPRNEIIPSMMEQESW